MVEPLDPVDQLSGIGAKARASLAEHGVHNILDLIWTPPLGWDDLRSPISLKDAIAKSPERCAFAATVKSSSILSFRGRRTVRVVLEGDGCTLQAFWFFLAHGVLAIAKAGARVLVVGKVTTEAKKPARMAHPEIFTDTEEARVMRARYPKLGIGAASVKKAIASALESMSESAAAATPIDPVPPAIVTRESMSPAWPIVRRVHLDAPSLEDKRAFIERLAWAEAFTRTWERLEVEEGLGAAPAEVLPEAVPPKKLFDALGFQSTKDQREAISEVTKDLASKSPMRRLLLGDVGTGKTAVALAAIAQCVAAKRQTAVLAPTTVLADQYMRAMKPLEKATGARVVLIAAGMSAADRQASEALLARGEADVAVGTHALLSEGVAIPNLALVVVDEQQRLGVGQRLALVAKGTHKARKRPHLLTLSATPIPRTLSLVLRGELAVSTLRELPYGHQTSIPTGIASKKTDLAAIVKGAKEALERGERVFWIVPRVGDDEDEDDDDDVATAAARAKFLRAEIGQKKVAIVHGRLSAQQKNDAMNAFRSGASPILVGTTVVEVGIDVPEATLMIIEDADRFGLAQLHQLRGRVGRGGRPGACVLLVNANLVNGEGSSDVRAKRLALLTKLATGEEIARADLELRGAGDLGGTRQHGAEDELVYLDPGAQHPWLERIEEDARHARKADPGLNAPEHQILRASLERLRRSLALRTEAG